MAHILIIEDDPDLGPLLRLNLEREGFRVTLAQTGRLGLTESLTGQANLIILDLMLPLMDGMHILQRMRSEMFNTPVIILSAKGGEAVKLEGFRSGCDDFVAKPFSLMELISRINAVLRRSGFRRNSEIIHLGRMLIDPEARKLEIDSVLIELTPKEFDLLYELILHRGQALSRSHLLDDIWGEHVDITGRTVDNHIASLRKKLDELGLPNTITTIYKLGYRFDINS